MKSIAYNFSQINSYISSKVEKAERIALELETIFTFAYAYDIKNRILGEIPVIFFEYFENRKNTLDESYTIGTMIRYKCVK